MRAKSGRKQALKTAGAYAPRLLPIKKANPYPPNSLVQETPVRRQDQQRGALLLLRSRLPLGLGTACTAALMKPSSALQQKHQGCLHQSLGLPVPPQQQRCHQFLPGSFCHGAEKHQESYRNLSSSKGKVDGYKFGATYSDSDFGLWVLPPGACRPALCEADRLEAALHETALCEAALKALCRAAVFRKGACHEDTLCKAAPNEAPLHEDALHRAALFPDDALCEDPLLEAVLCQAALCEVPS